MSHRNKRTILVVNPGSTSTKIALFNGDELRFIENIAHRAADLDAFASIIDQLEFRKKYVLDALLEKDVVPGDLDAVAGRGGLVRPISGGTYRINDAMLEDLKTDRHWGRTHASNLGALIADSIASDFRIPAFIVDPVTTDEMDEIARISGLPGIERKSLFHCLNQKAVAREAARCLEKEVTDMNVIGVHVGGGISVAAIKGGRVIDVNNAVLGSGPFSPQRAGTLPLGDIVDLCFSGSYDRESLREKLTRDAGLRGYLGTDDCRKIVKMIDRGDSRCEMVYRAMVYQIAKEVGGCACVLEGKVDVITLTGGVTYDDKYLIPWFRERVEWIAPVMIFPGEREMEALARGVVRVLDGKEAALSYPFDGGGGKRHA
jgi:butyrate kinase